jgi:deoxyribonuclease-2
MIKIHFILAFILFTIGKYFIQNSCISPEGNNVDWYVIYLFPTKGGDLKFSYIDNKMKDFKMLAATPDKFPPIKMTEKLNSGDDTYVIWNDDQTNGDDHPNYNFNVAHSKGVLAFNSNSGSYMIHSLPRFPLRTKEGKILSEFATNVGYFGQTFFCMSISFSQVKGILDNLLLIDPMVILHHINEDHLKDAQIHKRVEQLADIFNNGGELMRLDVLSETIATPKKEGMATVKTSGGVEINIFIKTKHDEIPWNQQIPNFYADSFYVETWVKPHLLPNVCGKQNVYNILEMDITKFDFLDTEDHSKWGVNEQGNVVCYGDLNRTEEQEKRTGTIACFKNATLGSKIRKFITKSEKCKNKFLME